MTIRLPFQPQWRPLVLRGHKTTTIRTRRHGNAGDTFDVEGTRFVLTRVEAMPLARARNLWREEGMASPEAFETTWIENHPTRGYRPQDTVWVHHFKRQLDDAPAD